MNNKLLVITIGIYNMSLIILTAWALYAFKNPWLIFILMFGASGKSSDYTKTKCPSCGLKFIAAEEKEDN